MSIKQTVSFVAVSTLNAEAEGDDWVNEYNNVDLRIFPTEFANLYLDAAAEPNQDGCEMYMRTAACGFATMLLYMEVKGWYTKEQSRDILNTTIDKWLERSGQLGIRKPPPGGIAG